jgi:hypothetical protein
MWTSRILRCHAQQPGWTAVVDTSKLSPRLGEILSSSPRQSTFDLRPTLFRSTAQCVLHVQRHLRSHLACSAQQSQCPAADVPAVLAPGAARRSSSKFLTVRLHRSSRAVLLVSVRRYPPVRDALQRKGVQMRIRRIIIAAVAASSMLAGSTAAAVAATSSSTPNVFYHADATPNVFYHA